MASPKREKIFIFLVLALICWTAHFWNFRNFGLYEDDYAVIGLPMGWSLPALGNQVLGYLSQWPQGRPVGWCLLSTVAFFGYRLGGLQLLYLTAFALVTINSFLLYQLLRRELSPAASFLGALTLSLFPADTASKTLLTMSLSLQPALICLLTASHCYLSGRRRISYLIIAGSLLTYETTFMPFFGIALVKRKWDRSILRESLGHALILGTMMLAVLVIRGLLGEGRVVALNGHYTDAGLRILTSMVVGPYTTIRTFAARPVETWRSLQFVPTALIPVTAVGLFGLLSALTRDRPGGLAVAAGRFSAAVRLPEHDTAGALPGTGWFCLGGLAMFVFAYGLTFTYPYYPPTIDYGRVTTVHVAASVGASLLFAGLSSIVLSVARVYRKRMLVMASLAVYFSVLVAFHSLVQRDFVRAWHFQRSFWTQVLTLCPDMTDGTVIFYEFEKLPLRYILANSWADAIILREIYRFPPSWQKPPRLFSVSKQWQSELALEEGRITWQVPPATWEAHRETLPEGNLILLHGVLGEISLTRVAGPLTVQGRPFPLKNRSEPALHALPSGPLSARLIHE